MTKRPDETQTAYTIRLIKAEAWREGWLVGNRWAFSDADADSIERNPYDDGEA